MLSQGCGFLRGGGDSTECYGVSSYLNKMDVVP